MAPGIRAGDDWGMNPVSGGSFRRRLRLYPGQGGHGKVKGTLYTVNAISMPVTRVACTRFSGAGSRHRQNREEYKSAARSGYGRQASDARAASQGCRVRCPSRLKQQHFTAGTVDTRRSLRVPCVWQQDHRLLQRSSDRLRHYGPTEPASGVGNRQSEGGMTYGVPHRAAVPQG